MKAAEVAKAFDIILIDLASVLQDYHSILHRSLVEVMSGVQLCIPLGNYHIMHSVMLTFSCCTAHKRSMINLQ